MRRHAIAIVLVAAACGRVGFSTPAVDAGVDSGDVDASLAAPPMLVAYGNGRAAAAPPAVNDVLRFEVTTPPGTGGVLDNGFLLVAIGVSGGCRDMVRTADVMTVTYATRPLFPITEIQSTPCNALATRSALWGLAAPDPGTADVVVTLTASAPAIHGGAVVLAGVDQTKPVRASVTRAADSFDTTLSVSSESGDLVVGYFGHGWTIESGGAGQNTLFIKRGSMSFTLDNSSMSTAPGAAPTVTMDWNAGAMADEWQMILASVRPAPAAAARAP